MVNFSSKEVKVSQALMIWSSRLTLKSSFVLRPYWNWSVLCSSAILVRNHWASAWVGSFCDAQMARPFFAVLSWKRSAACLAMHLMLIQESDWHCKRKGWCGGRLLRACALAWARLEIQDLRRLKLETCPWGTERSLYRLSLRSKTSSCDFCSALE